MSSHDVLPFIYNAFYVFYPIGSIHKNTRRHTRTRSSIQYYSVVASISMPIVKDLSTYHIYMSKNNSQTVMSSPCRNMFQMFLPIVSDQVSEERRLAATYGWCREARSSRKTPAQGRLSRLVAIVADAFEFERLLL